jgi:ribosomal protein L22
MAAKDAGKKVDQPNADVEPDAKVQQDAAEAKAAVGEEKPKRKPAAKKPAAKKAPAKKKPVAKKAEGTAAEATGVDKEAAEAALEEGSAETTAAAGAHATEEKPKPKRRRAPAKAKADEKPAAAAKPATKRRREAPERVTVRAHAKYVRTSARKARLVADHVRGKSVDEARSILAFHPRSVADDWRKLLNSAIANAEHNHDLVGDDLRILTATADEGPTLKRFRPRAMGRATRIRKRTSHLTITLTPKES